MRLSTKIFLAINLITLIPATILSRYIFEGITPTGNGFSFNFGVLSYVGIGFMVISMIFGTICYVRFLRTLKLSRALFFSLAPLTLFYGIAVYLIADLSALPQNFSQSVRKVLNVPSNGGYNSILWAVIFTIIYIFITFLTLAFLCRPVQKIEKATERLGDGRMSEKELHIGKSKQFRKIETSLEKINYNYKEKENLVKQADLEAQKFVPKEFLRFLGKSNISELELGNQVQKRGTTLFCDLLSSSKVSTTLSLEENFNFINSYLNVISPLVRKYDGFVDKYMGDGILAVFPRAERAVECAHAISRLIDLRNRNQKDLADLDLKISINTGDIIFGVVGEEERKSPTVISDVVNLASKMEDVNKFLGARVIFSKQTLNEIPEKFDFEYRYVGSLSVEGAVGLPLFESLEVYSKDKRVKLFKLKNRFENGVRAYNDGLFKEAKGEFEEVLKYVPDDKPSYIYFNKASEKLCEVIT